MVAAAALALSILTQRHQCLAPPPNLHWFDAYLNPVFLQATEPARDTRLSQYLYYDRWHRLGGIFRWVDDYWLMPRPPKLWQVPPRSVLTQSLLTLTDNPVCPAEWLATNVCQHKTTAADFFVRPGTDTCPIPEQLLAQPVLDATPPVDVQEHDFTLPSPWLHTDRENWYVEWYGRDARGQLTVTTIPIVSSVSAVIRQIESYGSAVYSKFGQVTDDVSMSKLQRMFDTRKEPPRVGIDSTRTSSTFGWLHLFTSIAALMIFLSRRSQSMHTIKRLEISRRWLIHRLIRLQNWCRDWRLQKRRRSTTPRRQVALATVKRRPAAINSQSGVDNPACYPLKLSRGRQHTPLSTRESSPITPTDLEAEREARLIEREREVAEAQKVLNVEKERLSRARQELEERSSQTDEVSRKVIDTSERANAYFESARRQLEIAETKEKLANKNERILQTRLKLLDGREAMLESRARSVERKAANTDLLVAELGNKRQQLEEEKLEFKQREELLANRLADQEVSLLAKREEIRLAQSKIESDHKQREADLAARLDELVADQSQLLHERELLQTERDNWRRECVEKEIAHKNLESQLSSRENVLEKREQVLLVWRRRLEDLANGVAASERELKLRAREVELRERELQLALKEHAPAANRLANNTRTVKPAWNRLQSAVQQEKEKNSSVTITKSKSGNKTTSPPTTSTDCERALDIAFSTLRLPPGFESWPQ